MQMQMQWVADLETPHMCYHAEFGYSRSNRVRISRGESAKLRSVRAPPPWVGGMVDSLKTSPSPYVLIRPILSFFFKECSHRFRITPKTGERGAPRLWDGPWLTP